MDFASTQRPALVFLFPHSTATLLAKQPETPFFHTGLIHFGFASFLDADSKDDRIDPSKAYKDLSPSSIVRKLLPLSYNCATGNSFFRLESQEPLS